MLGGGRINYIARRVVMQGGQVGLNKIWGQELDTLMAALRSGSWKGIGTIVEALVDEFGDLN